MLLRIIMQFFSKVVEEAKILIFANICRFSDPRFLSESGNLSQSFPLHKHSLSSGATLFLSCLDPASSSGQRVIVNGLWPLRYCCSAVALALRTTCAFRPRTPPTWGQPVSDPFFTVIVLCDWTLLIIQHGSSALLFPKHGCKLYNPKHNP